ncbi:hypothetical protein RHMOL_Rhmol01G0167700 [Rhododendron molle]|nr:hypothetical protein RHMOL_Rhmol01G0167700 [Rhododendron molle]
MFPPENTCTNPHLLPCALAWGKEYRRAKERRGQVMTFRRWLDNITGVQRTETHTRAELEQFTVPDTDLERYLWRTLDYATYKDRYLATSLGVERELEWRIAEAEARRARGETGARGRGSHSSRSRGRGARPPAGGRGTSSLGRGESSSQVPEAAEASTPVGLPMLDWVIGVRDPSGARAMLDIPRHSHGCDFLPWYNTTLFLSMLQMFLVHAYISLTFEPSCRCRENGLNRPLC